MVDSDTIIPVITKTLRPKDIRLYGQFMSEALKSTDPLVKGIWYTLHI